MRKLIAIAVVAFFTSNALAENLELPAPVNDSHYRSYPPDQIKLGQILFYDRVMSGTYSVSCATCHNHDRASSNGFRIDGKPIEEDDELAVNGLLVYDNLKPSSRHSPVLFNLGAKEFITLFSDGRITTTSDGKLLSPVGIDAPDGLRDILALQALFPAVMGDELVGKIRNDISQVAHLGNKAIWNAIALRIRNMPAYWPHFKQAFPDLKSAEEITIVEIANAISAFVGSEWRGDRSPFDAYLRGDKTALSDTQIRGMEVFYGKGKCSKCHSGVFQTDHNFHNISMPHWRFDETFKERQEEINIGRFKVSAAGEDLFRYRTPTLRNIVHTAPYGQSGAYKSLKEAVIHHLYPLKMYGDFIAARLNSNMSRYSHKNGFQPNGDIHDMPKVSLKDKEVEDLIEFLGALTDPQSLKGRLGKPKEVPSALAID